MNDAPELYYFLQRLQNTPISTLDYSLLNQDSIEESKSIFPLAIVKDLLFDYDLNFSHWNEIKFPIIDNPLEKENYLRIVLILSYLLQDPFFKALKNSLANIEYLLFKKILPFCKIVSAKDCIYDDERREELIRICLQALELKPKNESINQSIDRLRSIDSIEREKMILATQKVQARAKELRERMAREEAEEAASKYNRE